MSPRLTSLCDDPADMRELPFITTGAEPLATRSPLLRLFSLDPSLSSLLTRLTHGSLLLASGRSRILSAASSRSMAVVRECRFSNGGESILVLRPTGLPGVSSGKINRKNLIIRSKDNYRRWRPVSSLPALSIMFKFFPGLPQLHIFKRLSKVAKVAGCRRLRIFPRSPRFLLRQVWRLWRAAKTGPRTKKNCVWGKREETGEKGESYLFACIAIFFAPPPIIWRPGTVVLWKYSEEKNSLSTRMLTPSNPIIIDYSRIQDNIPKLYL